MYILQIDDKNSFLNIVINPQIVGLVVIIDKKLAIQKYLN